MAPALLMVIGGLGCSVQDAQQFFMIMFKRMKRHDAKWPALTLEANSGV
jgi:hypothetical protein